MLSSEVLDRVRALAQEVSQQEGCILYDLEFVGRGGNRTLRVYIDTQEADRSVSIDDCANVSRGLSLLLDVEDIIPGDKYDLEISSPGLERVLTQTWHFQKFIGRKVEIKSNAPIPVPESLPARKAPLRMLKGVLKEANEDFVVVEEKDVDWTIERGIIHRAKLIFEFTKPGEKKSLGSKGKNKKSKKKRS